MVERAGDFAHARVGGERTVRAHASGKPARTGFRLVEQYAARASLLEATLHTGRRHQIRRHHHQAK